MLFGIRLRPGCLPQIAMRVFFWGAYGGFCDLAWRVFRMLRAASVAVLQMIFPVCARVFGADLDSGRRVAAR